MFGGNIKPTPFLCLVLKMLQIQPEKDIVIEFIKNEDFKYVRALGAYYLRLTGTALDCYKYLEPLLNDYRKIRSQKRDGNFELTHMDEFIDSLLHDERVCDVQCPRYPIALSFFYVVYCNILGFKRDKSWKNAMTWNPELLSSRAI